MTNKKPIITIIGYGRFGKLLADLLNPFGQIQIIDKNKIKTKYKVIKIKELKNTDWIIPAVPISQLKNVLIKINPYLKPGSVLMDVSSVKTKPCQWMKRHIKNEVSILGSHPMFGPDSAKIGLKGLQMIFCPIRISKEKLNQIKKIFKSFKLKIITTTPQDHDRQAAKSLAMVHFLGRALEKTGMKKQKISSMGYERLLAIYEVVSNDTWQLFIDMHKYNPFAKKQRLNLIENLKKINKEI